MTKVYLKTVLILIFLNATITALLGFVDQWDKGVIVSGIVNSSILIALIFYSYFFLHVNKIRTSNIWNTVFTFIPSLIMIILLTRNLIQINSGQIREIAYGINMEGYFKPSHLKWVLTGMIIIANYLRFRKNKK